MQDDGTIGCLAVHELVVQVLQFREGVLSQLQMAALHDAFLVHHIEDFHEFGTLLRLLGEGTQVVFQLPEIENVLGYVFFFTLHDLYHQNHQSLRCSRRDSRLT